MIWILRFLQHPGQTLILLGDFNARVDTDHQTDHMNSGPA